MQNTYLSCANFNLLPEDGHLEKSARRGHARKAACTCASGSGDPGLQELRLCFGADGGCGGLPRNKGATLVGRYSV